MTRLIPAHRPPCGYPASRRCAGSPSSRARLQPPSPASADARWHGNLNIRREGLDVGRLMSDVRDVMFSAGIACASGSGRPSHVLKAIGLSDKQAKSSIRLGFGRYTTLDEIEEAAAKINAAAEAQGL